MDPTVPAGAARLLDFVRLIEVGTEERRGYDVIYGFNQKHLDKPFTSMTVDEVIAAGPSWTKRFRSSASGGYQFMRATLNGLKAELGLRGSQVMAPNLQDRLGFHLLKRRGYDAFMSGQITRTEFGRRLAMEWASFPVLADGKGDKRQVKRGQSYYAGDGLNKALVAPNRLEAVIDEAKRLADAPQVAVPRPEPVPVPEPRPEELAPIGDNGGPPLNEGLTPIEQMNKPVKGAQGGLLSLGTGGAIVILLGSAGWLPEAWMEGVPAIALGIVVGGISNAVGAFVGSYRAPDKRFQS